jgi:hypothetical protein
VNSKPVAAGSALSGRRASSSHRELSQCGLLLRRLRRASWCALSLYLSFVMFSTAGEQQTAQPMNLFVDIASNRLADEMDISKKKRLDLGGVPVVLGGKRQDGAAPSIAAGVAGSYNFDLGRNVSMKTSGLVSRIHIDNGTGILSSGRIGGDFALKYQEGGSGLLLKPSAYATMQKDVLERMDYAFESKLWQAIGSNLDLTATVGQSWRVSELLYTDNRESGFGRLGVNIDLFDGSNLELAYGFNTTDGPLASHFRFTQGPTMIAHLALAPGWSLDGRYSLTNTTRGYDDNHAEARRHDLNHRLNLKSDWSISSTTGAEWHVSAGYDYEQTITDAPVQNPANHIASVNFGLNF